MARSCKTYRRWTALELDKLEELVGQATFDLTCRRWNYWATQQGIPNRTRQSLRKKCQECGWTVLAWGDYVRVGDVTALLNKHRSTIQRWIDAGWIERFGAGHASALSRHQLRQLARKRPWLFGGVQRSALVRLLELEELADEILEQYPKRWQSRINGHRIRWVDRGLVFPSYAAAARAAFVNSKAIRLSIIKGRLVCGMRFERVA